MGTIGIIVKGNPFSANSAPCKPLPIPLYLTGEEAATLRKLPDGSDAWASDAPEVLTLDTKVRDICERSRCDIALYHEATLLGVVHYDATGASHICIPDHVNAVDAHR